MPRPWMLIQENVHSLTEKQHRFYSNHSQKIAETHYHSNVFETHSSCKKTISLHIASDNPS